MQYAIYIIIYATETNDDTKIKVTMMVNFIMDLSQTHHDAS